MSLQQDYKLILGNPFLDNEGQKCIAISLNEAHIASLWQDRVVFLIEGLDLQTTKRVYSLHDRVFGDQTLPHKVVLLENKHSLVLELDNQTGQPHRLPFYTIPIWSGLYPKEAVEPTIRFPPRFTTYSDPENPGQEGAELDLIYPFPHQNHLGSKCSKYRAFLWVNQNNEIRLLNDDGYKISVNFPIFVHEMLAQFEHPAFVQCCEWLRKHFALSLETMT